MGFQVTLDGKAYNTDSLTLDESEQLEDECGKSWLELNPVRSSKEFRSTARVFLTRDHNAADIERILANVTIGSAMAAVEWVDDDLPTRFEDGLPKAEAKPLTDTLSSSPDRHGDGLPTSPAGNGSGTSSSSSPRSNKAP